MNRERCLHKYVCHQCKFVTPFIEINKTVTLQIKIFNYVIYGKVLILLSCCYYSTKDKVLLTLGALISKGTV